MCLLGIDQFGNVQNRQSAQIVSWTKNTSGPIAVISNVPAEGSFSNQTSITASISGSGVAAYKSKIKSGSGSCGISGYSAEKAVDVALSIDISSETSYPQGAVKLCILVKSSLGHWATTAQSVSWIKDTLPAQGLEYTLSGVPADPSEEEGNLNISIQKSSWWKGSDISHYRYAYTTTDTACSDATYSSWTHWQQPIIDAIGADANKKRICMIVKDVAGNEQAVADAKIAEWRQGMEPSVLSLTDGPAYDFGVAFLNTTYEKTFILSNAEGRKKAVAISAAALSSPYTFKGGTYPGTGGTCGTQLIGGASCTIVVAVTPTTTGAKSTSLSISYNSGVATENTSLSIAAAAAKRMNTQARVTGEFSPGAVDYDYFAKAVSIDGDTMAVGAPDHDYDVAGGEYGSKTGAVFVYTRVAGVWSLQQKIIADGGLYARVAGDYFGTSVSVSGDTLAVGSYAAHYDENGENNVSDAGAVFVYTRTAGVWTIQQRIVPTGSSARMASDQFGKTLSLHGNTLAVGAPNQDSDAAGTNSEANAGAVFIFIRSGTVWSQQQKIVPTGTNARVAGELFGSALSLYSDTLAVGVYAHDTDETGDNSVTDAGAVFMFVRSGSTWSLQQKLVASGTNGRRVSDYFGYAVSLYEDTVAVGAYGQEYDESGANAVTNSGAVFVFTRSAGTWALQQKVVASGTNGRMNSDYFGAVVVLDSDVLAVTSYNQNYDADGNNDVDNAGAVYVFARSGGTWTQEQRLVATGLNARNTGDNFGLTLSISGSSIVSGAHLHDYDADGAAPLLDSGAAFVFTYSTSWSLQQKLAVTRTGNGRTNGDNYGVSVALSGNTMVVGAYAQDFDADGANVTGSAGLAYVYVRNAGVWSLQQKLSPTGTGARAGSDYFGYHVDIHNDTVVVGAYAQDTDESGGDIKSAAGAAFVFTRSGAVWSMQQKLIPTGASARNASDQFGMRVAVHNDTVAVSAPLQDYDADGGDAVTNAGAVYVFTRAGGVWSQQQKIVGTGVNGRATTDGFGNSIALFNDTLAVGANTHDYDESGANALTDSGAVFLFKRTSGTWAFEQKVVGFGTNGRRASDYFGTAVALYQDTLAIGAYAQDYDATGTVAITNSGAVYIYNRSGSTWSPTQKLINAGTNGRMGSDYFGFDVAIDGTRLVVGAYLQDYDEDGNNFLSAAGAAYVFNLTGSSWTLTQKIAGFGTNGRAANDYFGYAVDVSGDTVASGVYLHDYDANGGDMMPDAGAVFVFQE